MQRLYQEQLMHERNIIFSIKLSRPRFMTITALERPIDVTSQLYQIITLTIQTKK